jgi:hypothetical protein
MFALLVFAILPGAGFSAISAAFLFPEWIALDVSYRRYQQLASSGASERDLAIAQAAENRHRINCFAEGVGVLLGGVILAIGVHGLCTLPRRTTD